MAERARKPNSGSNSARRSIPGVRGASNIKNNISKNNSLQSKEEEYKRLNEELEAKTANLVREAEEVMRDQESLFARPSLLENINTEDFLRDSEEEEEVETQIQNKLSRPPSKVNNQSRPQPQAKKLPSTKTKAKSKSNIPDNVAVPDDTFLTQFKDFSLAGTISTLENQTGDAESDQEDVLPQAAAEMGSEAQIRFLKAKLRVMQEELDRLSFECNKKDEESTSLLSRLKEAEDERGRLVRTNASQQTQIDKYKKISEDSKSKADSLENQLSAVRKELDSMKRTQKQQLSTQGATEVRLNRAIEEVDKYKAELQKVKTSSKESTEQEKGRVQQLLAENKRLEKQKNELMTGFKKQLKLIDILKRQKIHIEAAKMLQFSEEEFVKALEWSN